VLMMRLPSPLRNQVNKMKNPRMRFASAGR
jgi:hypothetical protein